MLKGLVASRDWGDARVYSADEWKERQEEYGDGAAATIAIDGSVLYQSFNTGDPPEEAALLNALAERVGYYIEMGHSWTLHFYPED